MQSEPKGVTFDSAQSKSYRDPIFVSQRVIRFTASIWFHCKSDARRKTLGSHQGERDHDLGAGVGLTRGPGESLKRTGETWHRSEVEDRVQRSVA